jgi:hypothetical protein
MSTNLLGKTVNQMHRQIHALRDTNARERQLSEGQVRQPEPVPEAKPDEFDLGIDNEADYDPKLIGALKKLGGTRKEIDDLKKQLAQRDSRDFERDTRRTAAMIDAAFAAMPEYEKIFGKGAGSELGTDKPEMQRRIAVLRQANIDMREIGSVGQLRARLKAATDLIYPASMLTKPANPYDVAETPKPANGKADKSRITPEEWDAAALARPTQRKGKELPKGDALAVAELTKKMRESSEVIPDSEELDGFFD